MVKAAEVKSIHREADDAAADLAPQLTSPSGSISLTKKSYCKEEVRK